MLLACNNYVFDDQYLDTRYCSGGVPLPRMHGYRDRLTGEHASAKAWLKRLRLAFACLGESKCWVTLGVWNLDLLVVIKAQHQLESYNLDSVAEHFLQDHKIELLQRTCL